MLKFIVLSLLVTSSAGLAGCSGNTTVKGVYHNLKLSYVPVLQNMVAYKTNCDLSPVDAYCHKVVSQFVDLNQQVTQAMSDIEGSATIQNRLQAVETVKTLTTTIQGLLNDGRE